MHIRNMILSRAAGSRFAGIAALAIMAFAAPAAAQGSGVQAERPHVQLMGFRSIEGDDDFARELSMGVNMALMETERFTVRPQGVTFQQAALANASACLDESGDVATVACYAAIADMMSQEQALPAKFIFGVIQRSSADEEDYDFIIQVELFDEATSRIAASVQERAPLIGSALDRLEAGRRIVARLVEQLPAETPERGQQAAPASWPSTFDVAGLSLLGGAVASFAVAIGTMIRLNDLSGDFGWNEFRRYAMGTDACVESRAGRGGNAPADLVAYAQSVCSEAEALEAVQYALLAAGGALALGGAAMLLLPSLIGGEERPQVSIQPQLGPRTAYVQVRIGF